MTTRSPGQLLTFPARPRVLAARTDAELAAVRGVRETVFGDEQRMIDSAAVDSDDARSLHALALLPAEGQHLPVATGRLTPDYSDGGEALIAWVATLPAYRGRGIGSAVIRFLLASADRSRLPLVVLSAQAHAIDFYERLGFVPFGRRYTIRGIEHQWMARHRPPDRG